MERIDKVKGTYERKLEEAEKNPVSVAVIRRLPRYHRYLGDLIREGKLRISSAELSRIMGVTASQIRQDFNCFGGFGQQGYGYNVKYLHGKIGELLGMKEGYRAVIVGAGNLGRAFASTHMFERRGVTIVALFDNDPDVIGTELNGIRVHDVSELGYPPLRYHLCSNLHPGQHFRADSDGHEPLYHYPGLCQVQYAHHRDRRRHQHRAGSSVYLRL